MTDSPRARTLINLSAVLYEHNIDLNFVPSVAFIPNVYIADSLRARTLINLSAVSNIDLNFVPSVAFISDVYIADSLRARTLINLSAVLYEQAAAQTSLSAEVSNISLRARTLINLSAVLYEQADAQSSLPAEVSIIDLNFVPGVAFDAMGNVELTGDLLGDADRVNNNNNNVVPTLQFSSTALLNLRLLASKRPASSGSDLDRGPLLAKRIKTDEDRKKSTHRQGFNSGSSLKLQKTSSDNDDVQLVRDNIEELICVGKVKHTYVQAYTVPYSDPKKYLSNSARNNCNNLNIMVTNLISREFGRVDMKSSTGLCLLIDRAKLYCKRKWAYNISKFHKSKNIYIYVLRSVDKIRADVADVFNIVISKSDKVPTREPSSYIKTELYLHQKQALYFIWDKEQDYSAEEHDYCKFYRLVITSEDMHCKQTIKKAYIILLERASLILFMI
ncbi:hypothetical protein HBI78_054420 [Parastagonospora nodorum]|nr:hypothetical protein HBI78_054420 [Parastagonospora nodorum]